MLEKYLVLSRMSLLAIIIRGLHGVVATTAAMKKKICQKLFEEKLTLQSWYAVRKQVFDNMESATDAQHSEGRIASLSGNHPLNALCRSATARAEFEDGAHALASIFARFDIRGYHILARDMKEVVDCLRGKVFLAIQKGNLRRMGYYGAMSAARSVAELGVYVFHCHEVPYSDELHASMFKGQRRVISEHDINLGDVFSFFGLLTTAAFRKLLVAVQRKLRSAGQQLSSCTLGGLQGDHDTVSWRTLLVLLCEARQAIKKFGMDQIRTVVDALGNASVYALTKIRSAHAQLMIRGYAKGRGECHCTAMLRAAAGTLKLALVKKTFKRNASYDAKNLRHIVLSLAFWRLCPKVTSRNIPELVALKQAVGSFKSSIDTRKSSPSVATLNRELVQRGITPPRGASKETLLNLVATQQASPSRPTKTLDELRVLVREHEGGRKILAWTAEECRTFLLKRKSAEDLRNLGVESGILTSSSAIKLPKGLLIQRLAKHRRMY